MSEQEVEEQISSDENLNDETGEENGTPDKNSNKSNFKKLSESLKAERADKARIAQEKEELEEELNAWRSENPDIVKSTLSKKSDGIDKWDLALFLVQNPEAKNHLEEVKEYMAEMKNPDLEKAWKYVKPTIPVESRTEMDFAIKSKWTTKKTDISKLSFEEVYAEGAYTAEQKREWRESRK